MSTELVVVDNGSEDGTPQLLDELAGRHACLQVISEPQPGRSRALNKVLRTLRGQVVLFTDDDVRVPRSWIDDMATPILTRQCDAVAGKAILARHLERSWLTPRFRTLLAELTDVSGDLPGMVGANMAASIEAARAIGFDETLGPGAAGFADDVMFNFRLKAAGWKIQGCDGPPVEHHLEADRLSRETMLALAVANGKSHALLWHHWLHADLRLLRVRIWRANVRLVVYRAAHGPRGDALAEREYDLVYAAAFTKALLRERGVVARYGDPADERQR